MPRPLGVRILGRAAPNVKACLFYRLGAPSRREDRGAWLERGADKVCTIRSGGREERPSGRTSEAPVAIDRRELLRVAAISAIGVSVPGLAGCARVLEWSEAQRQTPVRREFGRSPRRPPTRGATPKRRDRRRYGDAVPRRARPRCLAERRPRGQRGGCDSAARRDGALRSQGRQRCRQTQHTHGARASVRRHDQSGGRSRDREARVGGGGQVRGRAGQSHCAASAGVPCVGNREGGRQGRRAHEGASRP